MPKNKKPALRISAPFNKRKWERIISPDDGIYVMDCIGLTGMAVRDAITAVLPAGESIRVEFFLERIRLIATVPLDMRELPKEGSNRATDWTSIPAGTPIDLRPNKRYQLELGSGIILGTELIDSRLATCLMAA